MSFVLKSTGLINLGENLLPNITIPSIKIGLSIPSFLLPQESKQPVNQRLAELGEQMAQTDDAPFFHDNGILKAAPKKKVSHMKRRQKLYAPGRKQVKLNNNLNRCPACGHYKRSHFLCMHCVGEIKKFWKQRDAPAEQEPEQFANPLDEKILYPGKTERDYEKKLKSKDWLVRRPKTLPVE